MFQWRPKKPTKLEQGESKLKYERGEDIEQKGESLFKKSQYKRLFETANHP
jgi:hypothetical protein